MPDVHPLDNFSHRINASRTMVARSDVSNVPDRFEAMKKSRLQRRMVRDSVPNTKRSYMPSNANTTYLN